MSYRFRLDQTLEQNVRQIALEQLDRAISPAEAEDASWVHETRKNLKRVRSLFRLVRTADNDKAWRRRDEDLRDIARDLSSRRDSDVRRHTIATLEVGANKKLATALRKLADAALLSTSVEHADDSAAETIATAKGKLKAVREECADISIDNDFTHVIIGLATTHRKGRDSLAVVRENPIDEAFHDLRKAVQTHWRHMKLLSEGWPAMMQLRIDTAKEISLSLGNEHDLTMLLDCLEHLPTGALSAAEMGIVRRECCSRQAPLRAQSVVGAQRLFAQKPKRFAAEIGVYWGVSDRHGASSAD